MAVHRVSCIFQTTTGVPADRIVNTFHVDDGDLGVGELAAFAAELANFYDALQPLLPVYITDAGHFFEFYKLSDPPPRVPVYTFPFDFTTAPTGSPLPLEVACVMSFQGDPSSGINQATRRNRIFVGPLRTICIDANGRIDISVVNDIADAGAALLTSGALADWTWVAFSTKLNSGVPVTNGWVDNEPDTQRRRGRQPTTRVLW